MNPQEIFCCINEVMLLGEKVPYAKHLTWLGKQGWAETTEDLNTWHDKWNHRNLKLEKKE